MGTIYWKKIKKLTRIRKATIYQIFVIYIYIYVVHAYFLIYWEHTIDMMISMDRQVFWRSQLGRHKNRRYICIWIQVTNMCHVLIGSQISQVGCFTQKITKPKRDHKNVLKRGNFWAQWVSTSTLTSRDFTQFNLLSSNTSHPVIYILLKKNKKTKVLIRVWGQLSKNKKQKKIIYIIYQNKILKGATTPASPQMFRQCLVYIDSHSCLFNLIIYI